jgi:hypothetical protein
MRYVVIAVVLVATALVPVVGFTADMEGKVQSVNTGDRTITLDNGTTVWLAEHVALDGMREGAEVKLSYEDKDGKPVATHIEVK